MKIWTVFIWPVSKAWCYFHELIGGWCKLTCHCISWKCSGSISNWWPHISSATYVYSAGAMKLSDHTWKSLCMYVCVCDMWCDVFHLAPLSSVAGWAFPLNNGCNINTVWPCSPDLRSSMPFSFFFSSSYTIPNAFISVFRFCSFWTGFPQNAADNLSRHGEVC